MVQVATKAVDDRAGFSRKPSKLWLTVHPQHTVMLSTTVRTTVRTREAFFFVVSNEETPVEQGMCAGLTCTTLLST